MRFVVVDTDVASFGLRQDTRFDFYSDHLVGATGLLSFMSAAELLRGAMTANWGDRRRQELDQFIRQRFQIVNANWDLCLQWARFMHEARQHGRVLHSADSWIASTAAVLDFPLLTHNRKDFEYLTGLQVISSG